jgi:gas vesicle protein
MKMNYVPTHRSSLVGQILGGIALGAVGMYMLDPVQGNRRRALVRDKIYSLMVKSRKVADATSRDLANRVEGIGAETKSALSKLKEAATESSSPP